MRKDLAEVLERREQWAEAADVYSQIRMDSTMRVVRDKERLEM